MIPALLREAKASGVTVRITNAGSLKLSGERETVKHWLRIFRENKAAILTVLREEAISIPRLTTEEEHAIRGWLAHINETIQENIAEVLNKCSTDLQARAFILGMAESLPVPYERLVRCEDCRHYERTEFPHMGHCTQGEPEAIAGLWDSDRRYCERYLPKL